MRQASLVSGVVAALALLASAAPALARHELVIGFGMDGEMGHIPNVVPAPPEEVAEKVGDVFYEVICPPEVSNISPDTSLWSLAKQRAVKVTLSKPTMEFRDLRILSPILDGAVRAAAFQCIIDRPDDNSSPETHIEAAEIFGQTDPQAPVRLLVRAEDFGARLQWFKVIDEFAAWQERDAEERAHEQRLALQREREIRRSMAAQARAVAAAERRAADEKAGRALFHWLQFFGLLALAAWLYSKRDGILRWYYFLTPHPAQHLVDRALAGGQIDSEAFGRAVKYGAGDSPVERRVRSEQLSSITRQWRNHEAALRAQEARLVDEERKRAEARNADLDAQIRALEAAVAAEIAATRVKAWQGTL